ncbi:MAG TPA: PAS domain-containing protein [Allosphingosinicella sp.]|nr:PAS domain-containing protein [Allosphingosinicella sp.]
MQAPAPEQILHAAVTALSTPGSAHEALDALPAPVYVTDAEGRVTYFNEACVAFAGRRPVLGEDRWCVTWRLYTDDGEFLPHDQCPMAVAVRERRPVRGVEAVAERPDGTRRNFQPFPTPVFDEGGVFAGAVNMLIDISDRKRADYLAAQAARCRRLAATIGDKLTVETLSRMADEYDARAADLGRPH